MNQTTASPKIRELTLSDFDRKVDENNGVTLVDFGAPWCPPCRALVPTLESLADKFQRDLKVFSVNVDNEPELALRFGIKGLPTVIIFKNGEQKAVLYGKQSMDKYSEVIRQELEKV